MDFVKDFWGFLKVRKKFWLLPIILTLLLFGVLIVLTSGMFSVCFTLCHCLFGRFAPCSRAWVVGYFSTARSA